MNAGIRGHLRNFIVIWSAAIGCLAVGHAISQYMIFGVLALVGFLLGMVSFMRWRDSLGLMAGASDLTLQYAGLWQRVAASLIDCFVFVPWVVAHAYLYPISQAMAAFVTCLSCVVGSAYMVVF